MNSVQQNVKVIKGTLDSHGQGIAQLDVGAKRDVVFSKEDGTLERIKVLGTLGMLGNYTNPGTTGEFHILEVNKDLKMLIGINRSDGKKITDVEAYENEYKKCKSLAGQANGLIFLGILLIPVLLVGLVLIFQAMSIKGNCKPLIQYEPKDIEEYLTQEKLI